MTEPHRVPGTGNDLRAKLEHFVRIYDLSGGDWTSYDLLRAAESVRKQAVMEEMEVLEAQVEKLTRMGLLPEP